MINILNCKKCQIQSRLAVISFLFAFGFLSILGYFFFDAYVDQFSGTDFYYEEIENVANTFQFYLGLFDYLIVIFMIILIISVAVTSYSLVIAPVFFIVMFISAAFEGAISYFFNYLFAQIVTQGTFNTVLSVFPRTILICTSLHWISLVSIIVGAITLYGKKQQGQFMG